MVPANIIKGPPSALKQTVLHRPEIDILEHCIPRSPRRKTRSERAQKLIPKVKAHERGVEAAVLFSNPTGYMMKEVEVERAKWY